MSTPTNPTDPLREALAELVALRFKFEAQGFCEPDRSSAAWAAARAALAKSEAQPVAVARLLHWIGPAPHPVVKCIARTFTEYPVGTNGNRACWQEGVPLYASPQQAQPDAYPALQALTEAVLTRADADYMRRQLDEAVRIMATRGWSPPVPYPQQAQLRTPEDRAQDKAHMAAMSASTFKQQPQPVAWRQALELIATPKRPDGTWNRDREACRVLAAEALNAGDSQEAQPVPEPMSDDDIERVIGSWWRNDLKMKYAELCRAIERATVERLMGKV